eukprot:2804154-Amphidinium_carterae.1
MVRHSALSLSLEAVQLHEGAGYSKATCAFGTAAIFTIRATCEGRDSASFWGWSSAEVCEMSLHAAKIA